MSCKHYDEWFGTCDLTERGIDFVQEEECPYAEEAGVDLIDCPDYEENNDSNMHPQKMP